MSMSLPISIACWDYDRVRALTTGAVAIEGCAPNFITLGPEEVFFRAFRHHEFDVTELSFSSYTLATSRGNCPYTAIPVFISRVFRHSGIYIRTDRGIKSAADLKGKTIGVPEYQMTAAVWIRGILEDMYGVPTRDVHWRSGGLEEPGRHEKIELNLSKEIDVKPIPDGATLNAMFERGELDAVTTPRAPSCYVNGAPHIARLFPNFRDAEKEYFRKTGIFPIMHVIGIRKTLVEKNPWLAASLFKAFSQAKAACMPNLTEVAALKISLPWVAQEAEETMAVMGKDFWPYGVPANRKTLDAFVRYHHTQGLSDRQMRLDELFVASTLEQAKI
ncbi:MAG: ABC transporter substrate-binding protein [Alphaproteobacteria bacterium]